VRNVFGVVGAGEQPIVADAVEALRQHVDQEAAARPSISVWSMLAQLLEPPYTDPYVRWCGRGGAERLPPIPIYGTFPTLTGTAKLRPVFGHSRREGRESTVITGKNDPIRRINLNSPP
jgi:hypothetical protein